MPGILAFPGAPSGIAPGVTVTDFVRMIPAGLSSAPPLAPVAASWVRKDGSTMTPGTVRLGGGVASGASVAYIAALGFNTWRWGPPPGANESDLTARAQIMAVPDGPWRTPAPAPPEPSVAVCGFRQTMLHLGNPAAGTAVGCGWVCAAEPTVAGDPWGAGPLPNGDNDLVFPTNTRPYVALLKLNAGAYQVRVRGNDGVSRLYPLATAVNPLVPHVVDFRVYRATTARPARYALYIGGSLMWEQEMSAGAGPGGESASPTAGNVAVLPFFHAQGQGGPGGRAWDIATYRGYDILATTDRG